MTATVATRAQMARKDPTRNSPSLSYRLTFLRLVRSEWIKLRSLRSPWWSIAIVAVLSVGISLLTAFGMSTVELENPGSLAGQSSTEIAVMVVLAPTTFTALLATIIGAIQVTGEYSTGMIRSTLTAAPRRIGSLLAKTLVVAVFVFVASLAIFGIAAVSTAPILARADIGIDLADLGGWVLPILSGGLTMAVLAIIGVSAGYLLRSGAAAISLGVGIAFVLPIVVNLFAALPALEWISQAAKYLPTIAGQALMSPSETSLDWPLALVALGAWAVVGVAGAIVVLRTRDA